MLTDLFYEFDKVKLKRNGTVVLVRNKFKFWQRKKVHATELLIKEIPNRIERFSRRFSHRDPYYEPQLQQKLLDIINADVYIDPVEYLHKEFILIKWPIHEIRPSKAVLVGSKSVREAFDNYRKSLVRTPIFNLGSLSHHIRREYNKSKSNINLNLKRILNRDYFPVKQLMSAA
jgi:hypothetical protein